jgi:hypothetical protein
MYFKRPSFRKGGSTGIGQLTSRVKANMGFPNFGVSYVDGEPQILKMKSRPTKESGKGKGILDLILGERYTNPDFVSPFLNPDAPFFSNRTGFEFLIPGGITESTTFITEDGPQVIEGNTKITSDSDDLTTDDAIRKAEANRNMQEIIRKAEKDFKNKNTVTGTGTDTDTNKEDILTGELSMKDAIEGEVDILKDLLKDTGASKGEKALILAKAIKTPGTIADKLEVAGEGAVKLAKEERKQDKALILTAYKNYKAKELADGKLNTQETAVKNYVNNKLADKNNTKSKNELELEAWEIIIKGRDPQTKDLNKEFAIVQLSALTIPYQDALRDIARHSGKKDAASREKVEKAQEVISVEQETVKTPMGEVQATEVAAAENVEPMKEVPVMDFATLRARLPKEITDDIVQLLANSKEALQDFYYINSQNDVSSFNTKYGVNLILPPQVLA